MQTDKYRTQVNLSVDEKAQEFIKNNVACMSIKEMSRRLGIAYGKLVNNVRLMGVQPKPERQPKITRLEQNGYFDVDSFARKYKF